MHLQLFADGKAFFTHLGPTVLIIKPNSKIGDINMATLTLPYQGGGGGVVETTPLKGFPSITFEKIS